MAIVQIAVHDALNSIQARYQSYNALPAAASGASPDAAVAAATRTTLLAMIVTLPPALLRGHQIRQPGGGVGIHALPRATVSNGGGGNRTIASVLRSSSKKKRAGNQAHLIAQFPVDPDARSNGVRQLFAVLPVLRS
jgi:hypothetical protein